MIIFLGIMILFPLLVAIILKSKYLQAVIALSIVNVAVLIFDYKKYMQPERFCVSRGLYNCDSHTVTSLMLITVMILVSVIAWYLAFKQKENVSGVAANNIAKKTLTISSWIIVIFVILTIAGFVLAFSQI
jgi:hypothetical protein